MAASTTCLHGTSDGYKAAQTYKWKSEATGVGRQLSSDRRQRKLVELNWPSWGQTCTTNYLKPDCAAVTAVHIVTVGRNYVIATPVCACPHGQLHVDNVSVQQESSLKWKKQQSNKYKWFFGQVAYWNFQPHIWRNNQNLTNVSFCLMAGKF